MPSELTWRKAIEKVLSASATPLHYNEITEQIIAEGLRHSLFGVRCGVEIKG
jgi:hypothetical protein